MTGDWESKITNILNGAIGIVTKPVDFYRIMPKTGGLLEPILFMVVMGVVAGIIKALTTLFGIGIGSSVMFVISSIFVVPILITIFGFVGAAILYVIWKVMGSEESFETAFRCGAFTSATIPITTMLGIIPYIGTLIGLAWMTYLLVTASTVVHKLAPKPAWIVFGLIAGFLAITSMSSQYAAQQMSKQMGDWQKRMEEMSPEEAGKAVGEFIKGMEEGRGKPISE